MNANCRRSQYVFEYRHVDGYRRREGTSTFGSQLIIEIPLKFRSLLLLEQVDPKSNSKCPYNPSMKLSPMTLAHSSSKSIKPSAINGHPVPHLKRFSTTSSTETLARNAKSRN